MRGREKKDIDKITSKSLCDTTHTQTIFGDWGICVVI